MVNKKYIIDDNGFTYLVWWYTQDGNLVAKSSDTPFEFDIDDFSIPSNYSEITENQYNTIRQNKMDETTNDYINKQNNFDQRRGILNNLIENSDVLIGGIL